MSGYIYVILLREFLHKKESVLKIGRTNDTTKRLHHYPKGSIFLCTFRVNDCISCENIILEELKKDFKQRKDIGSEYFEGPAVDIIKTIVAHVVDDQVNLNFDSNNGIVRKTHKKTNIDLIICKYYEEEAKHKCSSRVKSMDIYKDFHDWLDSQGIDVNISMHKFVIVLKNAYGVQNQHFRFFDGVCASLCFPNLVIQDRKKELCDFLVSSKVKTEKGSCIPIRIFKEEFYKYLKTNAKDAKWTSEFHSVLNEYGYPVKDMNLCKSCNKPSKVGCCQNYSAKNRSKLTLVFNMKVQPSTT